MSGVQMAGGMPFATAARAPERAPGAERADRADEADRDAEADARARRRLEMATFPAVFLMLLGAPAEAEMPITPAETPVAVPGEGEGVSLDHLAEAAFLLGEDLELIEGEAGIEAAGDFWNLGLRIEEARGSGDDGAREALMGEFQALMAAHGDVLAEYRRVGLEEAAGAVAATDAARATASFAAADTLDGWGFNPEFRDRLARVVQRMKAEHGLDVEVIEGFRDQSRQNELWSQGRSRPGPVVTWTKDSRHTVGAAADLMIDGEWVQGRGAVLLSRLAAEEGLRTLGPKDPGHIELPGDLDRLAALADELGLRKEARERFGRWRTARPAPRRREPADAWAWPGWRRWPAWPRWPDPEEPPRSLRPRRRPDRQTPAPEPVTTRADEPSVSRDATATLLDGLEVDGGRDERAASRAGSERGAESRSVRADPPLFGVGGAAERGLENWVRRIGDGVPGLEMLRRIDAVQNASPHSALRRVLIALEGADQNPVGQVRLDVRGDRVDALFDVDDAGLARRIERDMASLRTQLASEGVDPGRLRVRTGAAADGVLAADLRVDGARGAAGSEAGRQRGGEGQGQSQGQANRDLTEQRREFREDHPSSGDTEPEEES